VLALALIHHLTISNNVPLDKIAVVLVGFVIIEFVPKDDSQVQRLLATRKDVFPDYTQQTFETIIFIKYLDILDFFKIKDTERTLYILQKLLT
jgi:hypothetical protein